jgi:hypothetical protein
MASEMTPRRFGLTFLLAVWLAVQFPVVALTPMWGYLLPHTHATRGVLTASDWARHLEAHRLGLKVSYTPRCAASNSGTGSVVLASLPDSVGAISLLDLWNARVADAMVAIPAHTSFHIVLPLMTFYAKDRRDVPPEPPPNV